MNSLFSKHRWMQVMWGILLLCAGAITIIFAVTNEGANVSLVLSICIAIVLFAYGLTIVFSSFLELKDGFFKYELIIGAFVIAVGIVFCMNIDLLTDIIVSIIAASMLVFGTVFAARAIMAFATKLKVWWIGLCIAFAVLFIAAGVLCIIFRNDVVNICYLVLGGILVVVGAIEVYMTIKRAIEANSIGIEQKDRDRGSSKKKAKKEKARKQEPKKNEPEVFDNEPEEEPVVEDEVPVIDMADNSEDEDKNEIIVKE